MFVSMDSIFEILMHKSLFIAIQFINTIFVYYDSMLVSTLPKVNSKKSFQNNLKLTPFG